MKPFRYATPPDPAAAVALVAGDAGAMFLGGGTNLVDHLKLGVATPDLIVDVRTLTSQDITDTDDGGLRIGAAVTNSALAADRRVRERWPVLAEALLSGATGQLRNMATAGGNPLQRTRCVYFQDVTTPCNKRSRGSGCAAIGGYTRYHAILGVQSVPAADDPRACIATHPSDMAVALTALETQVRVLGADGERTVPFQELHRLPGDRPDRDTVLEHGELITAFDLAPLPASTRSTYRKVRDRASYAFALVSVAAALARDEDGRVEDVRIALGGVAHKPWRATRAEDLLRGGPATVAAFRAAAEAELAAAVPQPGLGGGNAFKVPLAVRTLVATLRDLSGGRADDGDDEGRHR
jgi:xanthine dehydrogenase YagS FAD-binding subunit